MSYTNLRKEIVRRRRTPDGRVIRELECGHEQTQTPGSHANEAMEAYCKSCETLEASRKPTPTASCTAFVMHPARAKATRCGEPARYEKRGEPRCAFHFNRGAR